MYAVDTIVDIGQGINDLAISPINLEILASCSADDTIRLWSLNPVHEKEPCVALFAGEGHRATILSIVRIYAMYHGTLSLRIKGLPSNGSIYTLRRRGPQG
jgi:WD40 repeat protein